MLSPPPGLDRRVRMVTAPFLERQIWILGFCAWSGCQSLYDLLCGHWASLGLDVFIMAAMVSLGRSLQAFRHASQTGRVEHLASASDHLFRYVRFTVIVGFAGLGLMVALVVVLVLALSSGSFSPALLQGALHG